MFLLLIVAVTALVAADPISLPDFEDGRIVGGYEVPIELIPYQVSLNFKGRFFCGGSIISKNYVLTAAHCVVDITEDHIPHLVIRAGSNVTNSGGSEHNLIRAITNPAYGRSRHLLADSGLIEVTPPFEFGATRKPVKLPRSDLVLNSGALVTASGYGLIIPLGPLAKTLRAVSVPVVNKEKCRKIYDSFNMYVTNDTICAGFRAGRKDSCQGDSGGPLVYKNYQVGIVSWGYGCAEPGIPGVYASVTTSMDFIKKYARNLEY